MKSSLALLATAATVSATHTVVEWVTDTVTVTVTVDGVPTEFVQNSQPTKPAEIPIPETLTSSVVPSPPSPPPANSAVVQEPETIITTTQAAPPTPTPEPEPQTVVQTETQTPEPQPVSTTQPQQSSQPETETLAPSGSYQDTAIKYHNAYREDHSAGGLEWDATLAQYAANTAQSCKMEHDMKQGKDDGRKYGQNLATYGSDKLGSIEKEIGRAVAEGWYSEVKNYNFYGMADPPANAPLQDYGHFSQLVWKGSQKVGCATQRCKPGTLYGGFDSYLTVCNYDPPGNYQGQYGNNVGRPLGLNIKLST
ncbi:hypothetical protein V2A60_001689 [Cordyceps javanica]|uniref:SCP-like extracellular protein n=1 Tax=Cordyceps javanica TaxID=43265 RepID=A0A545VFX7_9HYPO|nr:SCP-like extracellular protein [Cordyceps javanica]TQW11801.1 SCP-like extracellular protein [Cordyceps javanica]